MKIKLDVRDLWIYCSALDILCYHTSPKYNVILSRVTISITRFPQFVISYQNSLALTSHSFLHYWNGCSSLSRWTPASPKLWAASQTAGHHPMCSPSLLIWHSGMLQWPSDAVWQARQGTGCLCQSRSITPSSGRTTSSTCREVTECTQTRPYVECREVSIASEHPWKTVYYI